MRHMSNALIAGLSTGICAADADVIDANVWPEPAGNADVQRHRKFVP
jgi:hypothetical protein